MKRGRKLHETGLKEDKSAEIRFLFVGNAGYSYLLFNNFRIISEVQGGIG